MTVFIWPSGVFFTSWAVTRQADHGFGRPDGIQISISRRKQMDFDIRRWIFFLAGLSNDTLPLGRLSATGIVHQDSFIRLQFTAPHLRFEASKSSHVPSSVGAI
ncbi:hypothetical protein C8J56DRAFT_367425 [Mycena floridula]|nr:hypothetical protein C8J56DRAFT_367425 [Mycena floridula]